MKSGDVNEYIIDDFHLTPQEKHCVTNLNKFEIKDDRKDLISSIYNFEADVIRKDIKIDDVPSLNSASTKSSKDSVSLTNDKKEKIHIVTIDDDMNEDNETYEQISIFDEFGD